MIAAGFDRQKCARYSLSVAAMHYLWHQLLW